MATTYLRRTTDSDLTVTGAIFRKDLSEGAAGATADQTISAPPAGVTGYGFTETGEPGVDGGSGAQSWTVLLDLPASHAQVAISVAVNRVDTAGTVLSSSGFTAEQTGVDGTVTFTLTDIDLGTWQSGDRLRVDYRFRSTHSSQSRSVTIRHGGTENDVVAPWGVSASQTIPVGVASEVETALPVAVATTVTVTVGTVTETETAQTVTAGTAGAPQTITVGTAAESEAVQPVTVPGTYAIFRRTPQTGATFTPGTDTPVAHVTHPATSYEDTGLTAGGYDWQVFAYDGATYSSGSAVVQDTVAVTDTVAVGTAAETEVAQPVTATAGPITATVGTVGEVETARTVAPVTTVTTTVDTVSETETAQPVATTAATTVTVGAATETETAQTVTVDATGATQTATVGTAAETEAAQTVTAVPGAVSTSVGTTAETEAAQPVAITAVGAGQTITVGPSSESETVLAGGLRLGVPSVTELETAATIGALSTLTVVVGAATETETAGTVRPAGGPTTLRERFTSAEPATTATTTEPSTTADTRNPATAVTSREPATTTTSAEPAATLTVARRST